MATQAQEKTNGSQLTQRVPVAVRPFGMFARDPFRNMESLRQMIDSFFDGGGLPELRATAVEPAVNLYEKDGTFTIECAVPGYKKDDISIEARGDQVTISGSYSQEKNEEKNHYHRHEMEQGSFKRTVGLPAEIDPDQVSAKLENGMLTIALRPMKAIKSKSIPITIG